MQVSPSLLPPISTYIQPEKERTLPAIHKWPEDDRPREKLKKKGVKYLSNAELIAILIGSGSDEKTAIELAQDILFSAGNNLADLARLDVHQLQSFRGVGLAKATAILAAMELARRRQQTIPAEKPVINDTKDILALVRPLLQDQCHESFYVLYLNHANKVLHYRCISNGGLTATTVDPRVVFQEALYLKATRLVVAHNHPSGTLKPSQADVRITQKLREAGKFLDIDLLDHVIVSDTGFCSFREDGLL